MAIPSFRRSASIEPLEARIAPALLVAGANLLGGSNPHTGESSVGTNSVTLVKVLTGQAIVWYDGYHVLSVSVGPNTTLDLTGDVGDIVANLTAAGRLTDSDNNPVNGEDGNVLLANNILGITSHPLSAEKGDIGNIITGGNLANLSVSGHLRGVYVGDGAFQTGSFVVQNGTVTSPVGLTVNPVNPQSDTGFSFPLAKAKLTPGASVSGLTVAIAEELQVFAGSGAPTGGTAAGVGLAGGSISNVHIVSSFVDSSFSSNTPSYALRAGAGGDGTLGGGAGGTVFKVVEETSNSVVLMQGGAGGSSTRGPGGAGGAVRDLDMQGDSAAYQIRGGDGGNGRPGGVGGAVLRTNFAGKTPNSGIIVAGDFTGDGLDDVLVVDNNTGNMVISAASAGGTTFSQLVQYRLPDNSTVVQIPGLGSTPSSAAAVDIDGDGDLDVVVAYKNSNSLGVYLNQGGGIFVDVLAPDHKVTGSTTALTFSPDKIAVAHFSGATTSLVISENATSYSAAHVLLDTAGVLSPGASTLKLTGTITDLVAAPFRGGDLVFASLSNGLIANLAPDNDDLMNLAVNNTRVTISGGVADLAADSTGTTLAAVGTQGSVVNLYTINAGGSLTASGSLDLHSQPGHPISARFLTGSVLGSSTDALLVLSTASNSAALGLYTPTSSGTGSTSSYGFSHALINASSLKNFVVTYDGDPHSPPTGYGVAALGGSLNHFTYSFQLHEATTFALPFSGKSAVLRSGQGGAGLGATSGGAGGAIASVNIEATEIALLGGAGGGSDTGAGGAGATISNPASYLSVSGETIVPSLTAEDLLQITAGSGGTPASGAATALGGSGGGVNGLKLILTKGDLTLTTGSGGDGQGGAGGNAGNLSSINILSSGNLTVATGTGGDALAGAARAGNGGAVSDFAFKLSLDPAGEANETGFGVRFGTGAGGTAVGGIGGNGGAVARVNLVLDGADQSYDDPTVPMTRQVIDSTIRVSFATGQGGAGATGGAGGGIAQVSSTSYFDQEVKGVIFPNYVVMSLVAGAGGTGSAGNGGAGGAVNLTGAHPLEGLTYFDFDARDHSQAPLVITAGAGGSGSMRGGAGGAVAGVVAQNTKFQDSQLIHPTLLLAANITAGNGGTGGSSTGGAGGSIGSLLLGVQTNGDPRDASFIQLHAGQGGAGKVGGAGGGISGSTLGAVNSDLLVTAGAGGDGVALGGAGGALTGLTVDTPQIGFDTSAQLIAGKGGNASANGSFGGAGGGISGITEAKAINSVINLLQAGDGGSIMPGALSGTGGKGGSITAVKTAGFLGAPTDGSTSLGVFDENGEAQGVFAGRGGSALMAGAAGAVSNVTARQISAIAAAIDPSTRLFAAASSVSLIRADVIGYDVDHGGSYTDAAGTSRSPSAALAKDGFILANAISGLVTVRDTTNFRFTA